VNETVQKGHRVRIVFEGDVVAVRTHHNMVRLRTSVDGGKEGWVTWDSSVTPSIEQLTPKYSPGDIGVYEGVCDVRLTVVFRGEQAGHAAGWYDVQPHFAKKVASPFNPKVRLLVRADGTPADQPAPVLAPAPENPPYVPQVGDVALCTFDGVPHTIMRTRTAPNYVAWVDETGLPRLVDPKLMNFELVVSGGKLVEGVGVRD
jgi:hypothetical protein